MKPAVSNNNISAPLPLLAVASSANKPVPTPSVEILNPKVVLPAPSVP